MFGYEGETPYRNYTSKETFKKHVQLLLLSNSKDSHYALIKDLNRFMFFLKKHHGKKHFCQYCLQRFRSLRVL